MSPPGYRTPDVLGSAPLPDREVVVCSQCGAPWLYVRPPTDAVTFRWHHCPPLAGYTADHHALSTKAPWPSALAGALAVTTIVATLLGLFLGWCKP